jgi:hypothetical protein
MQALAHQVDCLPLALWDLLLGCDGGFVSIAIGESQYIPGPSTIQHRQVENVVIVSVEDLARENERPLHVVGHLIDHHLGCRGDPAGRWLSEGGGVTSPLQQAGARLSRLFELEYGVDEIARANLRDYFAQSLAFYCRERKRLNVADPQITKWFRSTLWNEAFWRMKEQQKGK